MLIKDGVNNKPKNLKRKYINATNVFIEMHGSRFSDRK